MADFRRRFRDTPPRNKQDNVLPFAPNDHHRNGEIRRPWWRANWPMAFLIAAPFIGVGVVWLSDVEAFWGPQQSAPSAEQYDIRFSRCNGSFRTTCVIDGDTFWLEGGKIRIADINTPEISNPECEAERVLGERAAERLILLLNAGGISLEAVDRDEDAFGRKLRIVTRGGESIGATLVEEGLAEVWRGSRRSWC